MLYILHIPNLDPLNFGAWGMVYILHMPDPDSQNLEILLLMLYIAHVIKTF